MGYGLMTRILLLADVHGNLPALDAVLADAESLRPFHLVVAGDVVNWGPQSREVLERLSEVEAHFVRGNNEYYLLDRGTEREPAAWADYTLLPVLLEGLEDWRERIGLWPDFLSLRFPGLPPVLVVHGYPHDPWHGVYETTPPERLQTAMAGWTERILVTAHTHLPLDVTIGGIRVINPGSVGNPLDGDRRAAYAVLEGMDGEWRLSHRRVAYDDTPVMGAFDQIRFEERCGTQAVLVRREWPTAEIQLAAFNRWCAAEHPGVPREGLLERFTDEDRVRHTPPEYLAAARRNRELSSRA